MTTSFLLVVVFTTVFVYLFPQSYVASSVILVERTKAPSMRTEAHYGLEMIEVINTEMAIVGSRTVMERVVERLHLVDLPQSNSAIARFKNRLKDRLAAVGLLERSSVRDGWIRGLMHSVKTKARVNANIFAIRYGCGDPRLAADIVNAVTEEYVAHHLHIYSMGGTVEFYRSQMERAGEELDRLRKTVEEFKERNALTATEAKKIRLVEEMGSLRDDAAAVDAEYNEVLTHYDTQHPKAILLQERRQRIRERIDGIQGQLQGLERDQARVDEMGTVARTQEETYLSYRKKFEEARSSVSESANMANVRVIDYATVPERPRFPRLLYIVASVVAGGLLALVVAVVREYFDHRVLTPEAAEAALGVPVIGSLRRRSVWERLAGA